MSKMLVYFVMVLFVGGILTSPLAQHSDRKGYCKVGELYIKDGEKSAAPIGECSSLKCLDGSSNTIMGVGCGIFMPSPGCHMSKMDLTKRYPECCPSQVCP